MSRNYNYTTCRKLRNPKPYIISLIGGIFEHSFQTQIHPLQAPSPLCPWIIVLQKIKNNGRNQPTALIKTGTRKETEINDSYSKHGLEILSAWHHLIGFMSLTSKKLQTQKKFALPVNKNVSFMHTFYIYILYNVSFIPEHRSKKLVSLKVKIQERFIKLPRGEEHYISII